MSAISLEFKPTEWQQSIIDNFKRFNVLVVARGSGKTFLALQLLRLSALATKEEHAVYAFVCPELNQAKRVSFDILTAGIAGIPGTKVNNQESWIKLGHNGAKIIVLGLSDAERLRGMHLNGLVVDEFGDIPTGVWGAVLRPTIERKLAWAFLIGTPKAGDELLKMYQVALDDPENYQARLLTISDTKLYNEDRITRLRNEYVARGELGLYEQEYECNPTAIIDAYYYRGYMRTAKETGRIGAFPHMPGIPVECALDLGADGTAVWFAQRVKGKINVIGYYSVVGNKIDTILNYMLTRDYTYKKVYLPWDSEQERIHVDFNIASQFKAAGFPVEVLKKPPVKAGIMEATTLIRHCNFDEDGCKTGIEVLENYSSKVDKQTGLPLPTPKHDQYSHGADAWRYLAMGLRTLGPETQIAVIQPPSWSIFDDLD